MLQVKLPSVLYRKAKCRRFLQQLYW